MMLKKCFTKK